MSLEQHTEQPPSFRLDVPLHDLLTKPTTATGGLQPVGEPQKFPNPTFPQRPDLLGEVDEDDGWVPPQKRTWAPGQIYHAMQGKRVSFEASKAKLFGAEMVMRVTSRAVQIFGGYGYTKEFPVERYMRDAKLFEIGGGTSQIQRLIIADHVLR